MIEIVLLSSVAIATAMLSGIPISLYFFASKKSPNSLTEVPFFIALSLIFGMGVLIFCASIAYSFIGINNYFLICSIVIISLWLMLILNRHHINFRLKKINGYGSYILFAIICSIYFSKSQWDSGLNPRIFSGVGPDVSQNLLAASVAPKLGSTWIEASESFIQSLNETSLHQAAVRMFEIPSFVNLAGIDYLVNGSRWGLTVPFSQIYRVFGSDLVFLEIGSVLTITLATTLLVGFAIFRLIDLRFLYCILGSTLIGVNASFLNQYYNGGLSQAFGLIGNFGLLMSLTIILVKSEILNLTRQKFGIAVLSTASWIVSAVSYVDGTFVIALFTIIMGLFLAVTNRQISKNVFLFLIIPGGITLILNPIFTYSIWEMRNFRFQANQGTGIVTGAWRIPTENFGFFSTYTEFADSRSLITVIGGTLIVIVASILLIFNQLSKLRVKSSFSASLLAGILLVLISYILTRYGNLGSDYTYNKISTYLAPIIVMSLLAILFRNNSKFIKKYTTIFVWSLALISVSTSLRVENSFATNLSTSTIIPHQYRELIADQEAKKYFENYNYILPYKPAYNFMGLFGIQYWISKAPNDMDLDIDDRVERPLRLMCFEGENICKPKTQRINEPYSQYLNKFGIVEFASSLSSSDYIGLSIQDRFNYAFDEMGTIRQTIPDKYQGGNPYLK